MTEDPGLDHARPKAPVGGAGMTGAVKGIPLCLSILNPDWLTSLHTCRPKEGRCALEAPNAQA